jgi:hypothetical protein
MAKRKKAKMRTTRRRGRSVGAAATNVVMEVVGLTAGAIAARQVDKLLPNLNPTIRNAAKIAVGVVLPTFVKSPVVKSIGNGMVAAGGAGLAGTLLPALGAADEVLILSGLEDMNEVNGVDEIGADVNEVNGVDEIGAMEFDEE